MASHLLTSKISWLAGGTIGEVHLPSMQSHSITFIIHTQAPHHLCSCAAGARPGERRAVRTSLLASAPGARPDGCRHNGFPSCSCTCLPQVASQHCWSVGELPGQIIAQRGAGMSMQLSALQACQSGGCWCKSRVVLCYIDNCGILCMLFFSLW